MLDRKAPFACRLTGPSVHGISQARILEWVAVSQHRDQTQISCIAGNFFTSWLILFIYVPIIMSVTFKGIHICCYLGVCMGSVTQSCLTLSDPMDCGLPDSSVHGILQARILEWVAISFSRGCHPCSGACLSSLYCSNFSICAAEVSTERNII